MTVKQQDFYQSPDFNHRLHGVFVAVIKVQKLEVCIHKQNCTVEKLSEIQFTNMSKDTCTVSITIIICGIGPKIHCRAPCRQKFQVEFEAILSVY